VSNLLRFRGINRNGNAKTGCAENITPAQLAEDLYRKGWRSARIYRDGDPNDAGGINQSADGKRTWSGEQW
jgi:hypothetical protein